MSTGPDTADYTGSGYLFSVIRERLQRHSGPVLDFAIGRRPEPPPEWLPEFVREHAGLSLRRRRQQELDAFTDAAAGHLQQVYGVELSPSCILPAPSGRSAMSALAAALISPGDDVLVTEPGYPAFPRIAAHRHARVRALALEPCHGFAPDVSALGRAQWAHAVRVLALTCPNNPTGAVISASTLAALRQRLDADTIIFNDAVYGPLTYEQPPLSLLAQEYTRVAGEAIIELHSLGKLFALGPLGIAFLVGRADLVARIREYSDFAWSQISSLQLRVASQCLRHWQHVDRTREGFRDRLTKLRAAVAALGLDPYPTAAGMYLLCRAPAAIGGAEVSGASEAAEVLLRDHGLAVIPWETPPHHYLRFSAAFLPEELDALVALGRHLKCVSG